MPDYQIKYLKKSLLLVYSSHNSPRVEYIFSTLLTAAGVNNYTHTTDKNYFQNSTEAKINYSIHRISEEEIWIQQVNLLFENGIQEQEISCFNHNGLTAFYKTSAGDFQFDLFAASFYLMSRYEEYFPHKKDTYGRYAHENSLAYRENFLHLPLVNLWLTEFSQLLTKKFPELNLVPRPFTFLPTYDIDIASSYLYKGAVRNLGGFVKSMWNSEWSLVKERLDVLFSKKKDPFDSFDWLHRLHKEFDLKPTYFFLLANKNRGYDKNIDPEKQEMKTLVEHHSKQYDVGIHPSWQSGDNPKLLNNEIEVLQKLSQKEVLKSRQHYIRMNLPETYRDLINAGIKEDFSMGYGSINGFRASYCLPYLWYDLPKEEITRLTIYPFCYMDANSYYEQQYSSDEALQEMNSYYNITRQVNGLLVMIWHNHFLGSDKLFRGWKEVYERMIKIIKTE